VARPAGSAVSREEILEQELAEARKALTSARAEDVREARVLQAIEHGIAVLKPASTRRRPASATHAGEAHTLSLLWSDTHAGETVSLVETNGVNEYNWQIMFERLRNVAHGVRSHRDHYGVKARKLHIASLGDMLTGVIHQELAETNDVPFADSMVQFGVEAGDWIAEEFADEFEEITIDCVVGNHPRFSQKPRNKVSYDNGDYVVGHFIRQRLRGYRHITVNVPKSDRAVVDICGKTVLLAHGDGVRTTMVGVPWGGIIRHTERLAALFALSDVHVDHVFGGHWHNPQIAENFGILINGSVKGPDEYGMKKYGSGAPPVQLLAAFHPKWGITGVHKIDCEVA
jgi:predicted phosphodiesterase